MSWDQWFGLALLSVPFALRGRAHEGMGRAQGLPPIALLSGPVHTPSDTTPPAAVELQEIDDPIPDRLKAPRTPAVAARLFARHMMEAAAGIRFRSADVFQIYADWSQRIEHRVPLQHDEDFLAALVKEPGVTKVQEWVLDEHGERTTRRHRLWTFAKPDKSTAGSADRSLPSPAVRAAGKRKRHRKRGRK